MTTTATSTRKAPAKRTAPAKAAAKPAATKAPAKAAPAAPKLRWSIEGERDSKGRAPATAGGYAITGSGDSWKATVKAGGKTKVLAEGSFAKCYAACVADNRGKA